MSDFSMQIEDFGPELSDDEAAMLAELNEKKMITEPGRKAGKDYSPQRVKLLKTLVYRDLQHSRFGEPHHYIFASRSVAGRF